ncbi:MAG: BREX-3 system P-loop-containing protein BrxF [Ignavibacteria bacterium]|nr:BREX-3 system P-loop-containing protein BrxF [Ignavibacteria bacterium]
MKQPPFADDRLEIAIRHASELYYRLVLVVGLPASGKSAMLHTVSEMYGCELVNVNLELSKKMLELTRTQRSMQVERLLKEVIASVPGDVVLLDNLEILFDTALELQPLRLLQVLDRNRTIVASWNGSFQGRTLIYAEPGHPEFMQFKQPEAVVVTVGKTVNN